MQEPGDFTYLYRDVFMGFEPQTHRYENGGFNHQKLQWGKWRTPIEYSNLVCHFLLLLGMEHLHHDHLKHIIINSILLLSYS